MVDPAEANYARVKDFLWPIGVFIVELILGPLVLLQYPDYFNQNQWLLPAFACLAVLCLAVPLIMHRNAARIWKWIRSSGVTVKVLGVFFILAFMVGSLFLGRTILKMHIKHMATAHSPKTQLPLPKEPPKSEPPFKEAARVLTPKLIPPKHARRTKAPSAIQVLNSADPYVGMSDQTVALWSIEEAAKIKNMGDQCLQSVRATRGVPPTDDDNPRRQIQADHITGFFWNSKFDDCCREAITKLHDSLVLRLGPPSLDNDSESKYKALMQPPQERTSLIPCVLAQVYSRYLQKMGQSLLDRAGMQ